ncbi:MBL fold metallo-hydrolase RNA specificity domain-containing protein [Streptomyces mutomycini]|uniref:MBL fold metallo-hydrolase RNA specificity domain-containing protein n=1 Tax=Streptomyces mutomycini TaxID=284036 RepID=UPI003410828D
MFGEYLPIRAEVADVGQIIEWLLGAPPPQAVYLVHGEPNASAALREHIDRELGWTAVVPRSREAVLVRWPRKEAPMPRSPYTVAEVTTTRVVALHAGARFKKIDPAVHLPNADRLAPVRCGWVRDGAFKKCTDETAHGDG